MLRLTRGGGLLWLPAAVVLVAACQSPTDPDDTPDVDDFLEYTVAPAPIAAAESDDGRTYRVVRGNNQPDDILRYDWKASFSLTVRLNDKADDEDYLTFPVELTSASIAVKQASGGIVTSPTGGEVEHSEYVVTRSTSKVFGAVDASNTLDMDVWYDLPSLRKEALFTVTLTFRDEDGVTFTKVIDALVAP
ncbi:MAG: hypothetical protein ACRD1U_07955 [Vicinamibacterales bacterium]